MLLQYSHKQTCLYSYHLPWLHGNKQMHLEPQTVFRINEVQRYRLRDCVISHVNMPHLLSRLRTPSLNLMFQWVPCESISARSIYNCVKICKENKRKKMWNCRYYHDVFLMLKGETICRKKSKYISFFAISCKL